MCDDFERTLERTKVKRRGQRSYSDNYDFDDRFNDNDMTVYDNIGKWGLFLDLVVSVFHCLKVLSRSVLKCSIRVFNLQLTYYNCTWSTSCSI